MSASPADEAPGARLTLDGELTVYTVEAVRLQLLDAVHADPHIDLDLSELAEIDGAGVQLLLATRREAESRSGRLRLLAASAAVADVLALAGTAEFGLVPGAAVA